MLHNFAFRIFHRYLEFLPNSCPNCFLFVIILKIFTVLVVKAPVQGNYFLECLVQTLPSSPIATPTDISGQALFLLNIALNKVYLLYWICWQRFETVLKLKSFAIRTVFHSEFSFECKIRCISRKNGHDDWRRERLSIYQRWSLASS